MIKQLWWLQWRNQPSPLPIFFSDCFNECLPHVSIYTTWIPGAQGQCQILWNGNHRWLWATTWVLRTKSKPYARTTLQSFVEVGRASLCPHSWPGTWEICLPSPLECWDQRYVPPLSTIFVLKRYSHNFILTAQECTRSLKLLFSLGWQTLPWPLQSSWFRLFFVSVILEVGTC